MNTFHKKMIKVFTTALLCSSIWSITAYAYNAVQTVHVGLSGIGSSITLSNKIITIGAEENGNFISAGTLKSEKGFTFASGSGTYAAVSLYYDSYDAAKQKADTISNALPAYTGGGKWQLYVSGTTGDQLRQKTGLACENVSSTANMILIQSNGKTIALTNIITPQFGAADNDDETITINNKQYRGKIQPTRVNGGSIVPVNAVNIEHYLYGVLPGEMSPSFATEALKAQAVASRTYALKKIDMQAHTKSGYDICDGTHCQSYKGKSSEFDATNAAVDATKGLVMYYQGEPIESVFFASSGGYTENSEDIWTAPLPYLKAVADVYEVEPNTWTKKFTASQLTNLTSSKGDNIGQVTDLVLSKIAQGGRVQELKIVGTSGTKVLTKDQVRTYFSSLNGTFPSKMFTINGRGSGSKTSITINAPSSSPQNLANSTALPNNTNISAEESIADSYVIGSDSVVTTPVQTQNYSNTTVDTTNIISTSPTNAQQRTVTVTAASSGGISTNNGSGTFVIEGKGNGHGAGMSQKGAQGMALQGYDFLGILHHYYTDVTIQ
ncbi:SpoIID/LytB domain-containing protein [Clostridium sp. MD294]|uniref:SpoIID/LytB domain-containing protein n=1 Tax=Clostridium sp. MD294 TaxID=97138 RepID=UPI0002CB0D6B|nr:SpoIID/LytB domain-containing protein [Clostridium sp. MD294]NDO47641.1 SpoIID/LytB domain-containing protein [Clostridium sp. MD294]USF30042.1 hypothetical protein C820_001465 [Clostridium sp. MD294]